ncbi:MAG: hypothetical protein KAI66_20745 [Lentisphaeria bacterium]|nr:hypothetical protein [Lentisphaeria bacterium]
MGLLDKLKSVRRIISGSGAEVTVEVGKALVGERAPVVVRAKVGESELKISAVYLLVRGCEEVLVEAEAMRQRITQMEAEMHPEATLDDEVFMEETFSIRVDIAGEQQLAANGEYEWTGELEIPGDALPSYLGRRCAHIWRIQAGLDAFGNDPDSGWVEFTVE